MAFLEIVTTLSSQEFQFWFITGLITVIGALLIHIHLKMDRRLDRIDTKLDTYDKVNTEDHAHTDSSLARIEVEIKSLAKDVGRIDREVAALKYYGNGGGESGLN